MKSGSNLSPLLCLLNLCSRRSVARREREEEMQREAVKKAYHCSLLKTHSWLREREAERGESLICL